MNNNPHKITNNLSTHQAIVAGVLPSDNNIEFVGVPETKQVLWLQNGSNHYFADLPVQYMELLRNEYKKNPAAEEFLSKVTTSQARQLELFTFYMYGALDTTPDIKNGILSPSENFRSSRNCPSLRWENKNITINDNVLTPRELFITDMFASNTPDKAIAVALGISDSYFNDLKAKLYKKAGVNTKASYVIKAMQEQIILIEN